MNCHRGYLIPQTKNGHRIGIRFSVLFELSLTSSLRLFLTLY